MKKSLLIGLVSLSLQAGAVFAQEPTTLPPFPKASLGAPEENGTLPSVAAKTDAPAAAVKTDQPAAAEKSAPAPATPLAAWTRCTDCPPRIWASSEFLMWWTKKAPVNTPLLTETTSPTGGAIGTPGTSVRLGGQDYDLGAHYGGRFTLGGWFDSEGTVGLEANYLFLSPHSRNDPASSPGAPIIGVPFFDVTTGKQSFGAASLPAGGGAPALAAAANLHLSNELQGGEINFVAKILRTDNASLVGLVGFRYVNFNEDLSFDLMNSAPSVGHFFSSQDIFRASNNFYGGNLGLRGDYQYGKFFLEATGKVALGDMNQVLDINGQSTAVNPGGPPGFNFTNARGGFFTQPTNMGGHSQNAFCVVPEAEFKIGYNFTRNIQGYLSYNFLYLSDVVRPGTTLDHNVNPSQVPALTPAPFGLTGPPAPTFSFSRSDFWAQGVGFGLAFKF